MENKKMKFDKPAVRYTAETNTNGVKASEFFIALTRYCNEVINLTKAKDALSNIPKELAFEKEKIQEELTKSSERFSKLYRNKISNWEIIFKNKEISQLDCDELDDLYITILSLEMMGEIKEKIEDTLILKKEKKCQCGSDVIISTFELLLSFKNDNLIPLWKNSCQKCYYKTKMAKKKQMEAQV